MPALADEGLDARRLALLARRMRRVDATIEAAVDAAIDVVSDGTWSGCGPITIDAEKWRRLPTEVSLRVLGRAIDRLGNEGPLKLGKLEALHAALEAAMADKIRLRRTLAGALITLSGGRIVVESAPPRSSKPA
jgi:tRNA(Ile)-lysidine synthase